MLKTISKKAVFSNQWITVYEKQLEIGDGKVGNFYVVGENQKIASVLAVDKDNRVVLTRQFRWAVDKTVIDVPGGGVHKDEEPIAAAKRELQEETGYTAGAIQLLTTRFIDPGQKDCEQFIFFANHLISGPQILDDTEDITAFKEPFKKVYQSILSGEYTESTLVISILLAAAKGLIG
jgi:ADP-ribose pyrophosphatase